MGCGCTKSANAAKPIHTDVMAFEELPDSPKGDAGAHGYYNNGNAITNAPGRPASRENYSPLQMAQEIKARAQVPTPDTASKNTVNDGPRFAERPLPLSQQSIFQTEHDFKDVYAVRAVLTTGVLAEVLRADNTVTKSPVCVKVIKKTNPIFHEEKIVRELQMMRKIRHKHCIRLHEVFDSPQAVTIVEELGGGGPVLTRLPFMPTFCERDASKFFKQILEGVAYLHTLNITHRDLKPDHIFWNSKLPAASDYWVLKIGDYSLSEADPDCDFLAPEVVHFSAASLTRDLQHAPKTDCWACGVLLYTFLSGAPAFYSESVAKTVHKVKEGNLQFPSPHWDRIHRGSKAVIKSLLAPSPSKRPTIAETLNHAWFKEIDSMEGAAGGSALCIQATLKEYNFSRKLRKGQQRRRLTSNASSDAFFSEI